VNISRTFGADLVRFRRSLRALFCTILSSTDLRSVYFHWDLTRLFPCGTSHGKDRASEITMDDLTAELRLRGLEPPYDAVKQELATRFAGMDEATQRKAGRKFAREIGVFIRESDKSLH
jgi:hypothetical protein